ncbi:MAG: 50S ribosomal protein L4 [Thermoplasmata archaeon]
MAKKPSEEEGARPDIEPKDVRRARKAQLQEWAETLDLDASGTVPELRERILKALKGEEYLVLEEEGEEGEEKPARRPKRRGGQVYLYSVKGKPVKAVDLPPIFEHEVRPDAIRRAVSAFQANRRQPYGPAPRAGLRHAVEGWGKGRGVSRVPRLKGRGGRGAQAPGTVGGRRAHPPRPDREWKKKLNKKERRLARASALAATADPAWVRRRGHLFPEDLSLPVILEEKVEEFTDTAEALELFQRLGVDEDLARASGRKVRAGRGTMRGRRYRRPKGPLVVLTREAVGRRAFANLPGVEIQEPQGLNAEVLAPGGAPGRLTLFSKNALDELGDWP